MTVVASSDPRSFSKTSRHKIAVDIDVGATSPDFFRIDSSADIDLITSAAGRYPFGSQY